MLTPAMSASRTSLALRHHRERLLDAGLRAAVLVLVAVGRRDDDRLRRCARSSSRAPGRAARAAHAPEAASAAAGRRGEPGGAGEHEFTAIHSSGHGNSCADGQRRLDLPASPAAKSRSESALTGKASADYDHRSVRRISGMPRSISIDTIRDAAAHGVPRGRAHAARRRSARCDRAVPRSSSSSRRCSRSARSRSAAPTTPSAS